MSLAVEACDAALADAGITRKQLDGLVTSPSMPRYGGARGAIDGIDVVTPWALSERLGIHGHIAWTGSTNAMVTQGLQEAAMAIAAASGKCPARAARWRRSPTA